MKINTNSGIMVGLLALFLGGVIFFFYQLSINRVAEEKMLTLPEGSQMENGKDIQTGLVRDEGLETVKTTCTACHSSALILQNRFSREGWHEKIVWMQETQGLWDLGEDEDVILDYLAAHYAPEESRGRRRPLNDIEWYKLDK